MYPAYLASLIQSVQLRMPLVAMRQAELDDWCKLGMFSSLQSDLHYNGLPFVPAHLDQAVCSTGYFVLRPKSDVNGRFLFYYLFSQTFSDEMALLQRGASYPAVSDRDVKEHLMLLPPLLDQQHIVATLDEASSAIATATTNVDKNLANAQELFYSALNHIFQLPQSAESSVDNSIVNGWPTIPLANACQVFTDGDWIETKDQSKSSIRLIQTGNVGVGRFKNRSEKARYISTDTFDDLKCTEVLTGDCLVSRLPDPVGRSCIIPDIGEKMITAVDCTIIRCKRDVVLPEFFRYYSQSRPYLASVDRACTGATRRRISRKNLGKVLIPIPSLLEQQHIVTFLDKLSAEEQSLVNLYETKIRALIKLKQSFLHKAFIGELTSK